MTPYESLMWNVWLPRMRSIIKFVIFAASPLSWQYILPASPSLPPLATNGLPQIRTHSPASSKFGPT